MGDFARTPNQIYRQVASLHAEYLEKSFLATLGVEFLTLMYQSLDECDKSVLICEFRDGKVVGFVSGAKTMLPIYRKMISHHLYFIRCLIQVIFNIQVIVKILEILRYSLGGNDRSGLPETELLSIVVHPQWRRGGVAKHLFEQLANHFRANGILEFKILVGAELLSAQKFYTDIGAVKVKRTEIHRGQSSYIYVFGAGSR